ncbi:UNVERIFIED_CONTAM: hypothetical protein NCL1_37129 [Trichonephila clavipes]
MEVDLYLIVKREEMGNSTPFNGIKACCSYWFDDKYVISDIGRGIFPVSGKKGNPKTSISYYPSSNGNTFPNRHIYYEPPEEFEFDPTSFLLPNTAGEVIVHRLPTSPDKKPDNNTPPTNPLKECSLPSDTPSSELSTNNTSYPKEPTSDKEQQRAYTKEEFTCAILARTQNEEHRKSCPALSPSVLDEDQIAVVVLASSMGESGVASMVRDSLTTNGQSLMSGDGRETCDCERRCSNPKHSHECKSGDYGVSPILERRNKGVLGRLRNFAHAINLI